MRRDRDKEIDTERQEERETKKGEIERQGYRPSWSHVVKNTKTQKERHRRQRMTQITAATAIVPSS